MPRGQRLHAFLQSGVPVWVIIGYLKKNDGDGSRTIAAMKGSITEADIDYAKRYYKKNKGEIERKLRSVGRPTLGTKR